MASWSDRRSRMAAALSSAAASKSSSSIRSAAPDRTISSALRRWCPAACGYGTTTIGRPNAATSASVDDPARPTTRSAAARAEVISCSRNLSGRYRSRICAGRASRPAIASSYPASPVMWMTRVLVTSWGSASATAELKRRTACEPPKISSNLSLAGMPSAVLASARVTSRGSRIGVPVRKHGRFPWLRVRQVPSKATARQPASRAVTRTLRPGTTLPSHITTGTFSAEAASRTGRATYPPVVKMAAGRRSNNIAIACGTESDSRIGSRITWKSRSTDRSDRSSRRRNGMPFPATTWASRPRWPPTQVSDGACGLACSDRATARAG